MTTTYAYQQGRPAPFQRIGITFPEGTDVIEGLREAKMLDWNLRLEQEFIHLDGPEGGSYQRNPNRFSVVRDNPYFEQGKGTRVQAVGTGLTRSYEIIHNETCVSFAHDLVQVADGGLALDSAAEYKDGSRCLVAFRMPENVLVGGVDPVAPYLFLRWSHDGGAALTATFAAWRVACTNQVPSTLGAGFPVYKVRHVGDGVQGRLADAQAVLGVTQRGFADLEAIADQWAQEQVTNDEFERIVERFIPATGREATDRVRLSDRAALRNLYHHNPNNEGLGQSAWSALNALTEWTQWYAGAYGPQERAIAQLESQTIANRMIQAERIVQQVAFA